LLWAALALPPAKGLPRWTYYYLFRLIAVIGMRVSEAIGLQRGDVDLDEGVLRFDSASPASLGSCLASDDARSSAQLRERRDAHLGSRCCPHFFVAERGGRLLHPSSLLAIISGDWPTPTRRSLRAARARLSTSVRDPNSPRLVSRGDRCRAVAPGTFHLSRPRLRARHILVSFGLSGTDARPSAAARSTVGDNVATLIERYFITAARRCWCASRRYLRWH
jgi:hypothetical protein